MKKIKKIVLSLSLLCAITAASAQLAVTVSSPKIAGQKAMVELKMKNGFAEDIKSARAVCFLLDEQGKMVGESAKWVIGGTKDRPALESKKETSYDIVIASLHPFTTTNLTAKISFSRLTLEDGKSVNLNKEVMIKQQTQPLSTNQVASMNNPVASKPIDDVIASAASRTPIKLTATVRTPETIMVTNLPPPPISHPK